MAINDAATLAIDSGNFFTAPVGTTLPADLTKIGTPWEPIGNTSLEDVLGMKSDGGDSTVLGTLQNKNLRTRRSNRTETMSIVLQQFDKAALKLYYGSNAKELPDGTISVPSQPTPTRVAFLAVFVDGSNIFAMYAPLAEILRGDDMDISDTESLVGLPLNVTPLNYNGNDFPYSVTPLGSSSGGTGSAAPAGK